LCGFFGIFRPAGGVGALEPEIIAAGQTLNHRGPDDAGTYCDERFGVHFQRLAIIDLSLSGHQPMVSDDGRLVLAFNGEIYNYRELRGILAARGHDFKGDSDSEVLLASFAEWGCDCVEKLRGMYAILCWDRQQEVLYVVRDRLGIKPLYLCRDGDSYLFASEIKAIRSFCRKPAAVNQNAVFRFLGRGWVDDTEASFYSDVTSLKPGSALKITPHGETRIDYWQPPQVGDAAFEVEAFRDAFANAVSLHLQSDVPLAATLSGGMDSSSIVALAARASQEPQEIQAYSVIPPQTVDESQWIDQTVEYTGISHRYLQPDWGEISDVFDRVLAFHDEPFLSSSCVYQYLLRREVAANGIKVLLVGEGGDEVLGGYRRMLMPYLYALAEQGREDAFNRALDGVPAFLGIQRDASLAQLENYRNLVHSGGSGQENISAYDLIDEDFTAQHAELVAAPAYPPLGPDNSNRFVAHLHEHLLRRDIPYVLRMEDRNSMAHGIEARVPFLDHIFLQQAFTYDYAEFMRDGENKSMLRRAMRGLLPESVVSRRDKSPRPGSNVHFVYEVMRERIRDQLASISFTSSLWWRNSCAAEFERDCDNRDAKRAEVWFRIYTLARWSQAL
jgi:asparagine synthase (glutamine-hydrolysing)